MKAISPTEYYIACLRLNFKKWFIIWISDDDSDGVLLDDKSQVIAFSDLTKLEKFAYKQGFDLKPDIYTYEIALLQDWLTRPSLLFDGSVFLNLWNLFIDVSESLKVTFLGDVKNDIRDAVYDKLFDIAGPFAAIDTNPTFNDQEVKVLAEIMQDGLDTLVNNLSFRM